MDEFIKLLNHDYELVQYRIKDKAVIFNIQSSKKELTCPFCGSKSIWVHSIYQREIQDLPIQDKQVILLVDTQKMFCKNQDCLHKTFADIHPFAAPRAKKTERLVKNIIHTSTQGSYGTVMVDLENHRIIDLIPSRETSDVAKWLAAFPNIQVVSRDGTAIYSSAVTDSHPDAVQLSDRFHLIKGLSEAINKYIIREFPARIELPLTEEVSEEMKTLYNTANRPLRIRFAHQKRKEGLTVADIALLLHSCPATVRKYLAIPEDEIPDSMATARERQHQLAMQQKQQEYSHRSFIYVYLPKDCPGFFTRKHHCKQQNCEKSIAINYNFQYKG